MIRICLAVFIFTIVSSLAIKSDDRTRLQINNCNLQRVTFSGKMNGEKVRPLVLNGHCGKKIVAFDVSSVSKSLYAGLYEPYGTSDGIERYEYVLGNGTTFKLWRVLLEGNKYWIHARGDSTLHVNPSSDRYPPSSGWLESTGSGFIASSLKVSKVVFKKLKKPKNLKVSLKKVQEALEYDSESDASDFSLDKIDDDDAESNYKYTYDHYDNDPLMGQMLHPAVGRKLGAQLRPLYDVAKPVPGMSIDGLFDSSMLHKALDFKNAPLSKWVGPEDMAYCCAGKFRLAFQDWANTPEARALHTLGANRRFIRFIEGLTGIRDIVPMKVPKGDLLWAGSNIIGVDRGGYLLVYNDVRVASLMLLTT